MQPTAAKKNPSSRRPRLDGTAGELLAAGVLLGLGVLALALIGEGPDWAMPRVLGVIALCFGVALGVRALVIRHGVVGDPDGGGTGADDRTEGGGRRLDVVVFAATAVAYVVLIPLVGLFETTLVMLAAMAVFLGAERNLRAVLTSVGIALAVCVIGYIVFLHVLYVPVPMNDVVSRVLQAFGA